MKIVEQKEYVRSWIADHINSFKKYGSFRDIAVKGLRSLAIKARNFFYIFNCKVPKEVAKELRIEDSGVDEYVATMLASDKWPYVKLLMRCYEDLYEDTNTLRFTTYGVRLKTDWKFHHHELELIPWGIKEKRIPYAKKRRMGNQITSIEVEDVEDMIAMHHYCTSFNARFDPFLKSIYDGGVLKNMARHIREVSPSGICHVYGWYGAKLQGVKVGYKYREKVKEEDLIERSERCNVGINTFTRGKSMAIAASVFVPFDDFYAVVNLKSPILGYCNLLIGSRGKEWLDYQRKHHARIVRDVELENLISNCDFVSKLWEIL